MAILDDIITARATGMDAIRSVFIQAGTTLEMLAVSDGANQYDSLFETASGWNVEYTSGGRINLTVATASADFADAAKAATHIRIGENVYQIERGDTRAPQGTTPVWQFFCSRGFSKSAFSNPY